MNWGVVAEVGIAARYDVVGNNLRRHGHGAMTPAFLPAESVAGTIGKLETSGGSQLRPTLSPLSAGSIAVLPSAAITAAWRAQMAGDRAWKGVAT